MKKFWNSDKIVSVSAIVIGIGSLIVVTYQTNLIRNQTELIQREQRTSVMPYLQFAESTPTANRYELSLLNSGLGPALINEVRMNIRGDIYSVDLFTYFQSNYELTDGAYTYGRVQQGELIPAETEKILIGADPKDSAFTKFSTAFDKDDAIFEIAYESLYGEKWLLSSDKNIPMRLEEED
jgi:hypothetical protein